MKESVGFAGSEYLVDSSDAGLVRSALSPKLKQGKTVNVFCAFSYFTSNYSGIFLMRELSDLIKQGCTVYLVMWDVNCECHPYFVQILKEKGGTPEKIIDEKMDEIISVFQAFGTPMSKLHLYRASDTMNRFIRKQTPNLFLKFYSAMEMLSLNHLAHKHKASHLIQMPLNMFFAQYFHELYPEELNDKIEAIVCYGYQESIMSTVRNVMPSEMNILKPALLALPPHPYLIYSGVLPEMNMDRDVLIQHILAHNPNQEAIAQTYNVILKRFLKDFELLDNSGKVKVLKFDEFMRQNSDLSLNNQQVSLAYSLHSYLQQVKTSLNRNENPEVMRLTNGQDTVKYAKILGRKRLIDVLKHIDGKKNATQLSKELKIARSNMSSYLNLLKKHDLVSIAESGAIQRKVSAISANFEVGLR